MRKILIFSLVVLGMNLNVGAKNKKDDQKGFVFTDLKTVQTTSVKNQSKSSTCWCFTGNGILENELLRLGKGEYDLSEMWIVRNAYYEKAIKYIRMHGDIAFSDGSLIPDVFYIAGKYGVMPEDAYRGLNYGSENHDHYELFAVLKAYLDAILARSETKNFESLSTAWQKGINGILDAYLGPVPGRFTYDGIEYTPKSFAQSLGLNMGDFVNITSYVHHPFYSQFVLEIPDNWAWGLSWNLPMDDMMKVLDNAIANGYSVAWAADVSEKGFAYMAGVAIIPEVDENSMNGTELSRWVTLSQSEKDSELYKFDKPRKEKIITQEMRQKSFDNFETTDDHGMIIVGIAEDQNGSKYYKVKNSWDKGGMYEGYFYASKPYVQYKTINILVYKDAIPDEVKIKMGI